MPMIFMTENSLGLNTHDTTGIPIINNKVGTYLDSNYRTPGHVQDMSSVKDIAN